MAGRSRSDGRRANELRPVSIESNVLKFAAGSALAKAGDTHVLCAATLQEGVPDFLEGTGKGWLTAEYGMLPASTPTRKRREATLGRPDGRAQEIRRIIGRTLRAAVDLNRLGARTLWMDCDVIQADGGTRTLAVTGAWVALALAVRRLRAEKILLRDPIRAQIAAVSVGVVNGRCLLDLSYEEDRAADVDMNVVMTGKGEFIEIQGTAEAAPFGKGQLDEMLALARSGCQRLMSMQRAALQAGQKRRRS